ncbi:MAG: DUF4328 domain-containing protein [Pirellulales bacterium]|nr:DUF4328 domain-containing protein [Pirellulales bacterium]
MKHTPQGAVGCWLIPILNIFRPFTYTREIWRASDPEYIADGDVAWSQASVHWILGAWWT